MSGYALVSTPQAAKHSRYRLAVAENCYDGLGEPEQLDSFLNTVASPAADPGWVVDGDANTTGPGSFPALLNAMCVHQDELWVVHIDAEDAGSTTPVLGPFVRRWDGATWQDMGFPTTWPTDASESTPSRPAIASDGDTLYVAFVALKEFDEVPCLPDDCAGFDDCSDACTHTFSDSRVHSIWRSRFVQVWKYDGSWTLLDSITSHDLSPGQITDDWFDQTCDASGGTLTFRANRSSSYPAWSVSNNEDFFSQHLFLAAHEGEYVCVWNETYMIGESISETTFCLVDVCPVGCGWIVSTSPTIVTIDNAIYSLSGTTTPGAGAITNLGNWDFLSPEDIVWDDESLVPLLLINQSASGPGGAMLMLWDARDGTVIRADAPFTGTDIAGRFISEPFANTPSTTVRYISGQESTHIHSMWQVDADGGGVLDPLDGNDAFQDFDACTNCNYYGKPFPETYDLWQIGVGTALSCGQDGEALVGNSQFDRHCPDDVPPERWRNPGQHIGGGCYTIGYWPVWLAAKDAFYICFLRSDPLTDCGNNCDGSDSMYHQVWKVPIVHCTGNICAGPPTCGQFPFTSNVAQGTLITWEHFVNSTEYDYAEFYLDNVLVWTDTIPTTVGSQNRFYYGNHAGATFDTGSLSLGPHEFKSISYSTEWGVQCEIAYTITITPFTPPGDRFMNLRIRIDGTEFVRDVTADEIVSIDAFQVGAYLPGSADRRDLDDVLVGTTGYGSSGLFSADFASAVVPPFDSVTGSVVASGGVAEVTASGSDSIAFSDLSPDVTPGTDIYFQEKVRFDASEIANGGVTGDVMDVWATLDSFASAVTEGLYPDWDAGTWQSYYFGDTGIALPAADTFVTVDIAFTESAPGSMMSWDTVLWSIDGSAEDSFDLSTSGLPGLSNYFTQLLVGSRTGNTPVVDHDLDNIDISNTGYGGGENFVFDGSAAIVPPFNSTTGSTISITSGFLHVVNGTGANVYAQKNSADFGRYGQNVWCQFDVRMNSGETGAWAAGDFSGDVFRLVNGGAIFGIYADKDTGNWHWYWQAHDEDTGIAYIPDTWQTIQIRFTQS